MGKRTTVSPSGDTSLGRPGLWHGVRRAAAAALATLLIGAAPAVAQQTQGIVGPGNAVVTGFSGTLPSQAPEGGDPFDYLSIDLNGPSARVIDLSTLGPQGQESQVAKPFTVTASQVGQVFGVALDNAPQPNIFLAATSVYGISIYVPDQGGVIKRIHTGAPGAQFLPGQFGPPEQGGGPGSIWRVDGVTGEVTLLSTIDSAAQGVASLGGLAFDPRTQQLFVADRGTGLIHRLSLDGTDSGTFDHGVDGRQAAGLAPVVLDGAPAVDIGNAAFDTETPSTWGFAPPGRRVFGLAAWKDRLYYAVAQQIWSVGIGEDGSFTGDVRFEADVPALQDGIEIASITFDQNRMYLAERGSPTGDYSLANLASEGASRVLRLSPKPSGDGSPGLWKLTPDEYAIGLPPNYDNANGGVALGYGYQQGGGLNLGSCRGTVWSTGERLLDPGDPNAPPDSYPALDGLQGNSPNLVKPQNEPPTQAWFVGYYDQPSSPDFRGHMGAIVILGPCGEQVTYAPPPPPPPVLRCPPGSTYQDGQCVVTVSCPRGSVYRSGYCVYESCPPGYVRYKNQCVPPPETCPRGTAFYDGDCVPVGCPPGMRLLQSGYCACPPGNVFYQGRCVPPNGCPPGLVALPGGICWCPPNAYFVGNKCVPNYCPPGYFRQGGECLPKWCQPGYVRGNDGFCHPQFNPCPPGEKPYYNYCVPQFCPPATFRGKDGYCYPSGNGCGPGQEYYGGGCVTACLPLFKRNNIGICISISDFFKKEKFCKGGKVRIGNDCVCPPGKQEGPNGGCFPAKGPGGIQLLCAKNHIRQGNQCVCPQGYQENANGVCVVQQLKGACGKGHIPQGNACVCPPGKQENNNGFCIVPPTGEGTFGKKQIVCGKGHVPQGNACVCPPGTNDNNPNKVCAKPQGILCGKGHIPQGNQCVCPPGTDDNNPNRVCTKPQGIVCGKGHIPQGNQCVCPAGTEDNNPNRVCTKPQAKQVCGKGHIPQGNACVCPPGKQENASGFCIVPPNGEGTFGKKVGGDKPVQKIQCGKGHVPQGNACVCPPGLNDDNPNRVCTKPPAKQVCGKGHIPQGNACVCPAGKQENASGFCIVPPSGEGTFGKKPVQKIQCGKGHVPQGNACVCPAGLNDNNPGRVCAAPQAKPQAKLQCGKGHFPQGNACVCPPGMNDKNPGHVCTK